MTAVLCPLPAPPSLADLEEELAAHGIKGLGRKPLTACPECEALTPNHRNGCKEIPPMPDPFAPKCRCGFPPKSLGCRMACGDDR